MWHRMVWSQPVGDPVRFPTVLRGEGSLHRLTTFAGVPDRLSDEAHGIRRATRVTPYGIGAWLR